MDVGNGDALRQSHVIYFSQWVLYFAIMIDLLDIWGLSKVTYFWIKTFRRLDLFLDETYKLSAVPSLLDYVIKDTGKIKTFAVFALSSW